MQELFHRCRMKIHDEKGGYVVLWYHNLCGRQITERQNKNISIVKSSEKVISNFQ